MTTSKLLGTLFLVAALYFLTQSPGWRFGYIALSLTLAFFGLLLVVRRTRRIRWPEAPKGRGVPQKLPEDAVGPRPAPTPAPRVVNS
jgi:hypothetical protein